jgi:hypothetical protein
MCLIALANPLVFSADTSLEEEPVLEIYGEPMNWVTIDPYGAVKRNVRWENPTIPVCWDEPPSNERDKYYRLIVKNAVISSWPTYSKIKFEGWDECSSKNARGVHILVSDVYPHTVKLGKYLDELYGGVVLNFDMKKWRPSCHIDLSAEDCLRYIAVHEFGHVLGFVHEHTRGDVPPECRKEVGGLGERGVLKLTDYDPYSIMNYCAPEWGLYMTAGKPSPGQRLETLTKLDRRAVAKHYGTNEATSIISMRSLLQ